MPTNELPMVDVLRLKALDDHRLWLRFSDGSEGVRDFTDIFTEGGPNGRTTEGTGLLLRAPLLRWERRPGPTASTSIRLISICSWATRGH